jgi:hypothetical protein
MAGKPEKRHIFISYKRKEPDKGFTHRLANDLRTAGHPIWMDVEGINPGTGDWRRNIQTALDTAYAFILIMSPDSMASRWVKEELNYAQGVDALQERIYPVMFRKVKPQFGLTLIQHVDFTDEANYKTALARLLESLPEPLRVGPHLPKGVEEALMSQSGWQEPSSRRLPGSPSSLTVWSAPLSTRSSPRSSARLLSCSPPASC